MILSDLKERSQLTASRLTVCAGSPGEGPEIGTDYPIISHCDSLDILIIGFRASEGRKGDSALGSGCLEESPVEDQ